MEPLVLALAAGGTAQVVSILVTALAALARSMVGQAEAKSKEKINKVLFSIVGNSSIIK